MVTPVSGIVRPRLPRANADGLELAHAPLAWTHSGGGVALQQLNMIEAFRDAVAEILRGDVIAEADEGSLVGSVWRGRE